MDACSGLVLCIEYILLIPCLKKKLFIFLSSLHAMWPSLSFMRLHIFIPCYVCGIALLFHEEDAVIYIIIHVNGWVFECFDCFIYCRCNSNDAFLFHSIYQSFFSIW